MLKKGVFIIGIMLISLTITTAQDAGFGEWTLTNVESARDYGETRQMVISPDGSRLAWSDSVNFDLCTYTFATDDTACVDYPSTDPDGNNALLRLHDRLIWSPDSSMIALTEEFFRELLESDIWIYDVDSATFTDFTNDDASGSLVRLNEYGAEYVIDTYPIWHPMTNDLYFFRYTPTSDDDRPYETALYRLPYNEGNFGNQPELVLDLTDDVPSSTPIFNAEILSFAGSAVFSPDGNQMAILVRTPVADNSVIWILDLTDNSIREVATFGGWAYVGIPEWEQVQMSPEGIAWTADNNLVFSTVDHTTLGAPIAWNVYQLNTNDGAITPFFDFSGVVDAQSYNNDLDADSNIANYAYPRTAILSPDGDTLLYFNFNRGLDRINLSSISLLDDGESVITSIPSNEFVFTTMNATTLGYTEDTLRLLMYGYLFTFTR